MTLDEDHMYPGEHAATVMIDRVDTIDARGERNFDQDLRSSVPETRFLVPQVDRREEPDVG
jgi:hypothetical protein